MTAECAQIEPEIVSLQELGYTTRQAEFLRLVCSHSGCFIARQFMDFCGTRSSRNRQDFTSRLVENRHVEKMQTREAGVIIYRIRKKLCELLDLKQKLVKVSISDEGLKQRLMALDFVLSHPHFSYLTNGGQIEERLTGLIGEIASDYKQARIFSEHQPVITTASGMAFVYLDTHNSPRSFSTWLTRHRSVFAILPDVLVYCVSQIPTIGATMEAIWRKFKETTAANIGLFDVEMECRQRKELEDRIAELSLEEMNQLVDLRKCKNASFYQDFLADGLENLKREHGQIAATGSLTHAALQVLPFSFSYRFLNTGMDHPQTEGT